MDDQRANREGSAAVNGHFQIGLRKVFGVMFWVCVFFTAYYIMNNRPPKPMSDRGSDLVFTMVFVLFFTSPILALYTFFRQPKT